jgi:hypothetical protein
MFAKMKGTPSGQHWLRGVGLARRLINEDAAI